MKKGKKENNSKIKAVVFDIGGVLQIGENQRKKQTQLHSSGVHETIAKKLRIPLDQYFDSIDSAYAKSLEGKITKEKLLEILSEKLKVSKKKLEKIYFKAYKSHFKLNKSLLSKIKTLKKKQYKLALLSDQWHLSKKAHLSKSFEKIFHPIILSCDVRIRKPSKKIYELLLRKLKLPPSQILFIDNQEWNIKPAKKMGFKTILFKNNKQLFEEKIWKGLFE